MSQYEDCYIKLNDNPKYWLVRDGYRIPVADMEELYSYGLKPVKTVSIEVMEGFEIAEFSQPIESNKGNGEQQIRTITSRENPFLSVITRAFQRPVLLAQNQESLRAQQDPDFEQILLIDGTGMGIAASQQWIADEKDRPVGEYILILDDDVLIEDQEFIADIKQIATKHNPDIIMFYSRRQERVLPEAEFWEQPPTINHVDMACFAVKAEAWRSEISTITGHHYAGDFELIAALFAAGHSIYWHDQIVTSTQQISNGKPDYERPLDEMIRMCLPDLFIDPGHILYVGANRCQEPYLVAALVEAGHKLTLLEAWGPNCDHHRTRDQFVHVAQGDIRNLPELPRENYDIAVWWHGPEHIMLDEIAPTLATLETTADLVVVGCPYGDYYQGANDGNEYERHLSTLLPPDLEQLGYVVMPVGLHDRTQENIVAWKRRGWA